MFHSSRTSYSFFSKSPSCFFFLSLFPLYRFLSSCYPFNCTILVYSLFLHNIIFYFPFFGISSPPLWSFISYLISVVIQILTHILKASELTYTCKRKYVMSLGYESHDSEWLFCLYLFICKFCNLIFWHLNNIPLCKCTPFSLSTLAEGHLRAFQSGSYE
jgi:hypothetical protein